MDKVDFTQAMKVLGIAYNKEFTSEQVGVWYEFFKDTNITDLKNAIQRIIAKNKYIPSIAELKQEIAYTTNPILQLDLDEEWDSVLHALRRYGYYRFDEAMDSLKPETRQIVRTIGWYRLCTSTDIERERRTFKELFNNKQDRYEETLVLSEPTMTLAELTMTAKLKEEERLLLGGSE